MAQFKTFDDGTFVVPEAPAATSAWHVVEEVAKPVDSHASAADGGKKGLFKKKGKKEADHGDGKAGIPGAVFNLANAVRPKLNWD